ncbi:MAG: UpxY family transcription antiterminator [bacterium]
MTEKKWFALYTKPKHEFKAEMQLVEMGIETYLPKITKIKQWSDRKKKIIEPLFKSYIFIFANQADRFLSVQAKGIIKVVNFNGVPATLPNWQIENLKKLLNSSPEAFVTDLIKIGTPVKIIEGPFKGVEGIIAQCNNDEHVLGVNIDLLQRSVIVHIPSSSVITDIEKIENKKEVV